MELTWERWPKKKWKDAAGSYCNVFYLWCINIKTSGRQRKNPFLTVYLSKSIYIYNDNFSYFLQICRQCNGIAIDACFCVLYRILPSPSAPPIAVCLLVSTEVNPMIILSWQISWRTFLWSVYVTYIYTFICAHACYIHNRHSLHHVYHKTIYICCH